MKKISKLVILTSSLSIFSLAASCNFSANNENEMKNEEGENKTKEIVDTTINLIFKNVDNDEIILSKKIEKGELNNKNLADYFNDSSFESTNKIVFNENEITLYFKKINKVDLEIIFNNVSYKFNIQNTYDKIQNTLESFKIEHNIDSSFLVYKRSENTYIIEKKVDQNTYLTLRDFETNKDLFSIKLFKNELDFNDISQFIPQNWELASEDFTLELNKENIVKVKKKTYVDLTIIYNDKNYLINKVENKEEIIKEKLHIFMLENKISTKNFEIVKESNNVIKINPITKRTSLVFVDEKNQIIKIIEKVTYGLETFDYKVFTPDNYELKDENIEIIFGQVNEIKVLKINESENNVNKTDETNNTNETVDSEDDKEEVNEISYIEEQFDKVLNFAKNSPNLVIQGKLTKEDFESIVQRYDTNTTETYRKMIYKDTGTFGFTKTIGSINSLSFNSEISEFIEFNLGNNDEDDYITFANVDQLEKNGTYKGGSYFNFEVDKENKTLEIIGKFTLVNAGQITKQSDLFKFVIQTEKSEENVEVINEATDEKQNESIDDKFNKILELMKESNFSVFDKNLSEEDYQQLLGRFKKGSTATYRRIYYKDTDVFGFTKTIGNTSSIKFNNQIKDFISKNLLNDQGEYIAFSNIDQIETKGTYQGGTYFNFEVNENEQTISFTGKFCLIKENQVVKTSEVINFTFKLNSKTSDTGIETNTNFDEITNESKTSTESPKEKSNAKFRIGHWNVLNYANTEANYKSNGIATVINDANMDIVGLTEIKLNKGDSISFIVDKLNEINPSAAYKFYVQPVSEATENSQPTQSEQIGIIYKSSIFEPTRFTNGKIGDSFNPEVENYSDPTEKRHYVRTPYGMKFTNKTTNKNITVVFNHLDSPGAKTKSGEVNISKTKDAKELIKGEAQGNFELTEAYGLIHVMNYFDSIDDDSSLLFAGDTNIKLNNMQVFKPMFDNGYLSVYGDTDEKHKTSLGVSNYWSQPYDKIFIKEAQSTNFITEQENPELEFKYDIYAAINAKIITEFKNNEDTIIKKARSISDHTLTWVDWEN
ncbi:MnuA family membrane nuclease [Mycoplasma anserisalpingitidis]|uniref:Uncharacterized protein n=1 Tax=Mycoplasma anserisalpingitidis TaxID=519450 RepID=A0A5B8K1L4_9MOLU|nr:hypothetical protein [Mycoplasma anserisalpingitidis]QDY88639.1 hypothetical protein FOY43_03175 [Mycoplasma anserisalpingitidis]